jgi:hypothetical protein
MNKYSDLQGTDLNIILEIDPIGQPHVITNVSGNKYEAVLTKPLRQSFVLPLTSPFSIEIELHNKTYSTDYETAAIIQQLTIDGVDLLRFNYLASYVNDHQSHTPTSYLGFNGKWILNIDRPFYQWLHQATKQGWLLG